MAARESRIRFWLLLCAMAFAALVAGAVVCGEKMAVSHEPAEANHLRLLVYGHFALAQGAVAAAWALLYAMHRRVRRYYLIVSYNEKGMRLNPPGISMPEGRVYRCHLGAISREQLPPVGSPVLVYPMFMLSGRSSGEKLERRLRQAYEGVKTPPQLYYQPVLGASPWLARAAAEHVAPLMTPGVGVLVVAHGSSLQETPPEPALFCRRLRELLPGDAEVALGYFNQSPCARDVMAGMRAERILLLPFLLTEGVHTERDLPTEADAVACGKQSLRCLPVVADLLRDS